MLPQRRRKAPIIKASPARETCCGVPIGWLDKHESDCQEYPKLAKQIGLIREELIKFQYRMDQKGADGTESEAEAALRIKFEEIDAEEMDEHKRAKLKLRAACQQIDPIAFYKSLEKGMNDEDPYARKLYADIMGIATEAKSQAKDDRPPEINIGFTRNA